MVRRRTHQDPAALWPAAARSRGRGGGHPLDKACRRTEPAPPSDRTADASPLAHARAPSLRRPARGDLPQQRRQAHERSRERRGAGIALHGRPALQARVVPGEWQLARERRHRGSGQQAGQPRHEPEHMTALHPHRPGLGVTRQRSDGDSDCVGWRVVGDGLQRSFSLCAVDLGARYVIGERPH